MSRFLEITLVLLAGAFAGLCFGVALGILLAPEVDQRRPLVHEWYIMAAFAYVVWSSFGGAMVGLLVGSLPTAKTFGSALAGLLIGLLLGLYSWDRGFIFGAEHRSYTGFTIIGFTFITGTVGGIAGGAWSWIRPPAGRQPIATSGKVIFVVAAVMVVVVWALALTWSFRVWGGD